MCQIMHTSNFFPTNSHLHEFTSKNVSLRLSSVILFQQQTNTSIFYDDHSSTGIPVSREFCFYDHSVPTFEVLQRAVEDMLKAKIQHIYIVFFVSEYRSLSFQIDKLWQYIRAKSK